MEDKKNSMDVEIEDSINQELESEMNEAVNTDDTAENTEDTAGSNEECNAEDTEDDGNGDSAGEVKTGKSFFPKHKKHKKQNNDLKIQQ